MNNYCVYKHTVPNGKVYIGITKQQPDHRWKNGSGYKNNNPRFWEDICFFGWENIGHEIICDGLSKEDAERKEIELINNARSTQEAFGYNVTAGGPGALGRLCSAATKQKIGEANQGHEMSQFEKERRSLLFSGCNNPMYGRTGNRNPRYGVKGDKHPLYGKTGGECKNSKKVLNATTGEIYVSATDAAKRFGIDVSSICACCKGRRRTCGGYEWQFI